MALFGNLFSSSRSSTAADLSLLKADIHSHLIPGIDDGSKTIEDSVAMISDFYNLGYRKIITSPHVMSDFYRNSTETILSGLEKVKTALREANIEMEMESVAEYYLDYDFENKLKNEDLLTFGNKYLLFEISYMNPPDNLNSVLFEMQTRGYKPILAHPERYNFWHASFEKYEELVDKGVLLQMNINSLSGHYSIPTKKIAEKMIDRGMISLLGSDCHHPGHVELMKKVVYEKYLHKLIDSGKLLNNQL
jgi:protein-tyrosine phosphatase